jgi:uncharacterized protein YbjT (DUF2867 family)
VKLLVIGASGHCGHWVTRLGSEQGHEVTAFVRPSTPFTPPDGVRVVRGQVLEPTDMSAAAPGHDAILSCVGPQRRSGSIFSPLKSPPRFCERSAQVIVDAAKSAGIRRVGAISAAGVGESRPLAPFVMRLLLRVSTLGDIYADLDAMEQVYAASGLDWFAVRPVTLVDAPPSTRAGEVDRYRASSSIGRVDVAQYMLDMLGNNPPSGARCPFIGWRR